MIAPDRLVATTVRLAGPGSGFDAADIDLLAAAGPGGVIWQHQGDGLAGRGTALRLELPAGLDAPGAADSVAAVLAAIPATGDLDGPGRGPVAIGALPFAAGAPGHLVVPEVIVGRHDGDAWLTVVAPPGQDPSVDPRQVRAEARRLAPPAASPALPSQFTLTSVMEHADWKALVARTVEDLRAGGLSKVVLARRVDVEANRPFVIPDVLGRLLALYPTCMVWSIDGFIGASPELLIARRGDQVSSLPLAGTVPRSGDVEADEALVAGLLRSPKQLAEHGYVIDGLCTALERYCLELDVPDKPSILELRNVSHLATPVTGTLAPRAAGPGERGRATAGPGEPARGRATGDGAFWSRLGSADDLSESPWRRAAGVAPRANGVGPAGGHPALAVPSALELVAAVHPTAAVGGTPTAEAVSYLTEVEGFDRGRYAGPVGWMDARGDGTWAIGLRSADVNGNRASLYAGVGVVEGSEPAAELTETQLKLQALLAALVRP
ncbi:MAG TPA: chorismate-binding protein [Acidimicrobiales bacterium]|nr:chorismate-binding protein [Acidimicrobiales bacterium]